MQRVEAQGTNGINRCIPTQVTDNTDRVSGNNETTNIDFGRILHEKREGYNPYQNQNQEKPKENLNDGKNDESQKNIHPYGIGKLFDQKF